MPCENEKLAIVILAAGLGTRMKSNKAKVLHEILKKPMVLYFDCGLRIADCKLTKPDRVQ